MPFVDTPLRLPATFSNFHWDDHRQHEVTISERPLSFNFVYHDGHCGKTLGLIPLLISCTLIHTTYPPVISRSTHPNIPVGHILLTIDEQDWTQVPGEAETVVAKLQTCPLPIRIKLAHPKIDEDALLSRRSSDTLFMDTPVQAPSKQIEASVVAEPPETRPPHSTVTTTGIATGDSLRRNMQGAAKAPPQSNEQILRDFYLEVGHPEKITNIPLILKT